MTALTALTALTLGIDIGGTKIRAAVVDASGTVLSVSERPTPTSSEDALDALEYLTMAAIRSHNVAAVGLAVAGFISRDCRRVMFAPHLPFRDAPVPELLSRRVGIPVMMDHDVNSAAWAEYRLGDHAGCESLLVLAIGTGIGAGLVLGGEVFRGAHGLAPELGHLTVVPGGRACPCGKRGCLERYCSGSALAHAMTRARPMTPATPLGSEDGSLDAASLRGDAAVRRRDEQSHDAKGYDVIPSGAWTGPRTIAAARDRHPAARRALDEFTHYLAVGLAMAADVLDPGVVVLAGGLAQESDLYLADAVQQMRTLVTGGRDRPVPVVAVTKFGQDASTMGAALLARARAEAT